MKIKYFWGNLTNITSKKHWFAGSGRGTVCGDAGETGGGYLRGGHRRRIVRFQVQILDEQSEPHVPHRRLWRSFKALQAGLRRRHRFCEETGWRPTHRGPPCWTGTMCFALVPGSASVSKIKINMFVGYFDPEYLFLDNGNK